MSRELLVFTNQKQSFIFCDFACQPIDHTQLTGSNSDVHYRRRNEIYIWECGFDTSENILEAYLRYGEKFIEHIPLGDSSFVLYDSAKEIVIAARDFMGVYPLYYYASPKVKSLFIFTFSMNALLASKLFEPDINLAKVVEYIDVSLHEPPNNHTFYQHVYRILPAYWLRIQSGRIDSSERYGKFDVSTYQTYTEAEFIERFRKLFIKSIKKKINGHNNIAASLSGGLDSSSVCSVTQSLRNEPIYTFNFDTQTTEAQENEYIRSVTDKWQNIHRTIQSTYTAYEAIKKITELNAQPFFVLNYTIHLDLIDAAKQKDCTIFLSGHWGDQIVNHGLDYFQELSEEKDWEGLKRAIGQHFQHSYFINSKKRSANIKPYILTFLRSKLRIGTSWKQIPKLIYLLSKHFDFTLSDYFVIARNRIRKKNQIKRPKSDNLIHPSILTKRAGILQEQPIETLNVASTVNGPLTTAQRRYLEGIMISNQTYGQEEYFEVYRQNSLRAAQPFIDAELLELNLNVPLRLKFDEGRKRGTLRKALNDYLPEAIANRVTKGNFTTYYLGVFKKLWQDFEAATPLSHPIWTIINKQVFDEYVKILLDDQYPADSKYVINPKVVRVIQLAAWLDYLENLKNNSGTAREIRTFELR